MWCLRLKAALTCFGHEHVVTFPRSSFRFARTSICNVHFGSTWIVDGSRNIWWQPTSVVDSHTVEESEQDLWGLARHGHAHFPQLSKVPPKLLYWKLKFFPAQPMILIQYATSIRKGVLKLTMAHIWKSWRLLMTSGSEGSKDTRSMTYRQNNPILVSIWNSTIACQPSCTCHRDNFKSTLVVVMSWSRSAQQSPGGCTYDCTYPTPSPGACTYSSYCNLGSYRSRPSSVLGRYAV